MFCLGRADRVGEVEVQVVVVAKFKLEVEVEAIVESLIGLDEVELADDLPFLVEDLFEL